MMNDLADARMRNLYCGLIGALVVAGAIVVGCANSADASERHHPQPRPVVKQNVTAKPTANARSESGGNSIKNDGDDVSAGSVIAFSEGSMSNLTPSVSECTVTDMMAIKGPLFGYAESTGEMTPWCVFEYVSAWAGEAFNTPSPGENPVAVVNTKDGFVARRFSSEEMTAAQFKRGYICEKFPDVVDYMNLRCKED